MQSWLELEKRFRELAPALQFSRLDAQWGAAGEYWRIAGVQNAVVAQQFEILAAIAGEQLVRSNASTPESSAEWPETNDSKYKWFRALKDTSPAFGNLSHGQQLNDDGSSAGFLYTGSLHPFSEASANLCLSLHASHPITEVKSKWVWFHENYGKALLIGLVLTLVAAAIKAILG